MEVTFSTAQNGLFAANQRLQTNADNLSNLTTAGFKARLAQQGTVDGPGSRFLGTAIDTSQGAPEQTGVHTHFYLEGEGFFRIARDGEPAYTRVGNFQADLDGNLVTPTGHLLDPQITVPEDAIGIEVTQDGVVFAVDAAGTATELGQLEVTRFPNPAGLLPIGDNLFAEGPNSGDPVTGDPGAAGFATIQQRVLEQSNVDPANEITQQIINQRYYQMNLRVFQTTDALISRAIDVFS
ncbi:MAG: flagellar hook-basal body protein [Planctomycetota bacterium]